MAPRRAGALPLVSSEVTSPSSAKREASGAHAAPSLEEILQGQRGRSGGRRSKPPPVLFLVIRCHVVAPLKLFEALAAQLGWRRHVSEACTRVSMK